MESRIAISLLHGIPKPQLLQLYCAAGSPTNLLQGHFSTAVSTEQRLLLQHLIATQLPAAMERAKAEADYCRQWGISVLAPCDADYPALLRECADAPLVLYYQGNSPLNVPHILSVVGTRRITATGIDICRHLCEELASLVPDTLVVSGLAYGVDIEVHRGALRHSLPTVGVLAHGLGQIYPAAHRHTAKEMTQQGGLLTEYLHTAAPRREHFVRRNRIVAGMAAATVVVESAERGGALITAQLAQDYNRSLFAYPGRPFDIYSIGCNRLIQQQKAFLVTSAADIVEQLGWHSPARSSLPVQRELFPVLTDEEQRLVTHLSGADSRTADALALATRLPIQQVLSLLFELELRGIVRPLVGGKYGLIQ